MMKNKHLYFNSYTENSPYFRPDPYSFSQKKKVYASEQRRQTKKKGLILYPLFKHAACSGIHTTKVLIIATVHQFCICIRILS